MTDPAFRSEITQEVPGTPEQVWDAIATAPGITAWFVPAEIADGKITMHLIPGETADGEITASERPHRFAYVEQWKPDGRDDTVDLVTEFLVEAQSGGTCVVRIVTSGFDPDTDWENELGSMEQGWRTYLTNLRLYLAHFPGEPTASIFVSHRPGGSADEAWRELSSAIGLHGDRLDSASPRLAGSVVRRTGDHVLVQLEEPAPGTVVAAAYTWGDDVFTTMRAYLFGPEAPAVAEREAPAWQAFLERAR